MNLKRLGFKVATIGLVPLIIAQGLYVRRITPRLPEPKGSRSGLDGSGPSIRLLILGDSAAAGVGVSTQKEALSGQLISALGSDFRVSWTLIAQTGHTAETVAAMLETAPTEAFDVVVTSIGVNDVTHGTMARQWIIRQRRIIDLLQSKFHARHIFLSSLPPMHLFPALPSPLRWYLGMRAKRFNELLMEIAADCHRCALVATHFPLEDAYMAVDGFHPGPLAYRVWADQIAANIRSRLASGGI
ncbi:MAG: SGNH/GDSL hydrolase family protein [Deltaproteobacteria bacterium]|nr:SGNH/GDSL hydrolase family protein [Deltaproteobacteria bacterium]